MLRRWSEWFSQREVFNAHRAIVEILKFEPPFEINKIVDGVAQQYGRREPQVKKGILISSSSGHFVVYPVSLFRRDIIRKAKGFTASRKSSIGEKEQVRRVVVRARPWQLSDLLRLRGGMPWG
ncbi:hypothetical protein EVAR_47897_1 [Eumeta japonica]|uniref:Uncharacterized protein n=1 Tax=Eumeta variegata TaxID=151549 RepID=A0A4C1Y6T4_EUMVA|nr:hypothetical protein EVAR_47897_1 [Eumeta japonica]